MEKYKQILRYEQAGISQRETAKILSISRNTVSKVIYARKRGMFAWADLADLTEAEIKERLFPQDPKTENADFYYPIDVDYMMNELKRVGVTKKLLWKEYVEECHATSKQMPYQYTQFCHYLNQGIEQSKATMYFEHVPGEAAEVDWAGQTYQLIDAETGEVHKVYFFVAALPYSQIVYLEPTLDMKQERWISAHVNFFEFLGGTPKIIICDNLRTGVTKHPKEGEVVLNAAYQELGDYYQAAIIPARPSTPKGKASAEGSVRHFANKIIAQLRNETFHTLYDLKEKVSELLQALNQEGFQKRKGSRLEIFLTEEKSHLQPLPRSKYEFGHWKTARVQYNYHISVDKMFYSVPYHYIKKEVRVRMTEHRIEVFYQNQRICSHPRRYGQPYQYVTIEEHMPENHRKAGEWDRPRFLNWANKIGPKTHLVVERLLDSYRVEQQAYRGVLSLLNLSKKYSEKELEDACDQALQIIDNPRYRNIKKILEENRKQESHQSTETVTGQEDTQHAYLRGQDYYGKKD